MTTNQGNDEFGSLFKLTCSFDPLKEVLKKMQDKQKEMQIELKLLKDELAEKASTKELLDTNHKVARVFNHTDNLIIALKEEFKSITAKNTEFGIKINEDLIKQDDKLTEFKKVFKDLENKSYRVDQVLIDHSLRFENYLMHEEMQKWQEKHDEQPDKEEVSKVVVDKIQEMIDSVALKVHRHSDSQLQIQDKIGDLETKVILLIQAAKNHAKGKDNSNLFDGIGDVVSAVDYFKEMMKGQYAKLTEFKEVEQYVETLNRFQKETHEEKAKKLKANEELEEKLEDMKIKSDKLKNELDHIKNERFKTFESQLIEKLDYNEFEQTIANIQNYLEGMNSGDSPQLKIIEAKRFGGSIDEEADERYENDDGSELEEDYKENDSPSSPRKSISPSNKSKSRDPTPTVDKRGTLSRKSSQANIDKTVWKTTGVTPVSTTSMERRKSFKKKATMRKSGGPSFIPRDTIRLKEFERKLKDVDDKLINLVKNSKSDMIPVIEKRLTGIREELENKASKLDIKKLIPDITEAINANKVIKQEMLDVRKSGLFGDAGTKIIEEVSLTTSKLSQLDAKFTWLHQSHKDLLKKMTESINASQPLLMNPMGDNVMSEAVYGEVKEGTHKLERQLEDLSNSFKLTITDLKAKISEKVDDRALNELEDTLTTDIDQTIRSFNRRFAEKQDTKNSIRHIERQIRIIQESMGIIR